MGKVREGDLKSQGKPDEIGLKMESRKSMGTAMKEEADDQEDEALCKLSIKRTGSA